MLPIILGFILVMAGAPWWLTVIAVVITMDDWDKK